MADQQNPADPAWERLDRLQAPATAADPRWLTLVSGFINRSLRHCHHAYGGRTLQLQNELQREGVNARWAHGLAVGLSDGIIRRRIDPRPLGLGELKVLLPSVTRDLQDWLYGGSGTGAEGIWGRTHAQEKKTLKIKESKSSTQHSHTHDSRTHPLAKAAIENPKAFGKLEKRIPYQPDLDPGELSPRERYCLRAAVLFAEAFVQATTNINLHMYTRRKTISLFGRSRSMVAFAALTRSASTSRESGLTPQRR